MTASATPAARTHTVRALVPTEHYLITWRGIDLQIIYQPDAHRFCDGYAELEVQSEGYVPLPIAEAGYRSWFVPRELVDHFGGPVDYIVLWLDKRADASA